MMKIVLTRSMVPGDIQYIKKGLDETVADRYEFVVPAEFTEEGICAEAADADVLLGPYVTKGILDTAKQLKLIQIPWTGMDTFNFSAVEDTGIPVCNTHSNADSVAELGVTLVLDLLKKVSYHDRKMRNGDWNRGQKPLTLKSGMVSKQTVCVLGCGNIGYRIAKLLHAFGANVIAVDDNRKADHILSKVYPNDNTAEAIKGADIVICTLPLTDVTRKQINAELIGKAQDGILLVNMSRAEILDEDAVYQALCSGKIGGFAADVWWNTPKRGESESYPSTHNAFWELDNVIMSPHRAGFVEGCLPHLDEAIVNLSNLIQGKDLINRVDVKKHY